MLVKDWTNRGKLDILRSPYEVSNLEFSYDENVLPTQTKTAT